MFVRCSKALLALIFTCVGCVGPSMPAQQIEALSAEERARYLANLMACPLQVMLCQQR